MHNRTSNEALWLMQHFFEACIMLKFPSHAPIHSSSLPEIQRKGVSCDPDITYLQLLNET